jgi:hypothetical protein
VGCYLAAGRIANDDLRLVDIPTLAAIVHHVYETLSIGRIDERQEFDILDLRADDDALQYFAVLGLANE